MVESQFSVKIKNIYNLMKLQIFGNNATDSEY